MTAESCEFARMSVLLRGRYLQIGILPLGMKGSTGEKGTKGMKGVKGVKGSMGEKGVKGTKGMKGGKGTKGIKGERVVESDHQYSFKMLKVAK